MEKNIRQKYQSPDLDIHIIGFAKVIGDITDGARGVLLFFGVALVISAFLLYYFSQSLILTLLPLDQYDDVAAISMQVVGDPDRREPIVEEFEEIVKKHEPGHRVHSLERFAFYERANTGFAIVQTGERRQYGNLILKKGVVKPG